MRTTLDLDPDVMGLARSLAEAQGISLGKALSQLARRGMAAQAQLTERNGFAVFQIPVGVDRFGEEDVRQALESEDEALGREFGPPANDRR